MTIVEHTFPGSDEMQERHYCVFPVTLENNNLVLFHGTHPADYATILSEGFKSAFQLKGEGLTSVSYAHKSSGALIHIRSRHTSDEVIIIAVRFDAVQARPGMVVNTSDIHVYDGTQPEIIGFCRVPASYRFI